MWKKRLLIATSAFVCLGQADAKIMDAFRGVRYDYPEQPSLTNILETDAKRTLLTDGKLGFDGPSAVWGGWNKKKLLVDWAFDQPVRISKMEVALFHPKPDSEVSHIGMIHVYASEDEDNPVFQEYPDFSMEVPFEEGQTQVVEVVLPEKGIVGRSVRTVFEAKRSQCVLSEVKFEAEPADAVAAAKAQKERLEAQAEKFAPVAFLPTPLDVNKKSPTDSFFGVCGHLMHTDFFYPGKEGKPSRFAPYWGLDYVLPFMVEASISWSREPLYRGWFSGDPSRITENGRTVAENREQVEKDLRAYGAHHVQVILTPTLSKEGDSEEAVSFARWIAKVANTFPAVRAVELHNEPNLKGFWKGTPQEFVNSSKAFAKVMKEDSPATPIIVGSFAGWGGAWQQEELRALISGPKEMATRYAEEVFRLGLLDVADGVSAHPYRCGSAPEGGEALESPQDPEGFAKEIRGWLKLVAQYSKKPALPFYISEIGYSVSNTGYSRVANEARQADYLTRMMLVLFGLRIEGVPIKAVCWYDLKQDQTGDPYEANFGLISTNTGSVRPAYSAYRRVAEFFNDTKAFQEASVPLVFSNGTGLIKSYKWKRLTDGSLVVAFWRMNQLQKSDADFASELEIALPEGFRVADVVLHNLNDDRPRPVGYHSEAGRIRVPLHVTARANWLVLHSSPNAD